MTPGGRRNWLRQPGSWVLLGFLAAAALFTVLEHRAHLALIGAFVLLVGCLHMNRYMHHRYAPGVEAVPEAKGEQL